MGAKNSKNSKKPHKATDQEQKQTDSSSSGDKSSSEEQHSMLVESPSEAAKKLITYFDWKKPTSGKTAMQILQRSRHIILAFQHSDESGLVCRNQSCTTGKRPVDMILVSQGGDAEVYFNSLKANNWTFGDVTSSVMQTRALLPYDWALIRDEDDDGTKEKQLMVGFELDEDLPMTDGQKFWRTGMEDEQMLSIMLKALWSTAKPLTELLMRSQGPSIALESISGEFLVWISQGEAEAVPPPDHPGAPQPAGEPADSKEKQAKEQGKEKEEEIAPNGAFLLARYKLCESKDNKKYFDGAEKTNALPLQWSLFAILLAGIRQQNQSARSDQEPSTDVWKKALCDFMDAIITGSTPKKEQNSLIEAIELLSKWSQVTTASSEFRNLAKEAEGVLGTKTMPAQAETPEKQD